jgi:hypothetical protein
MAKERQGFNFFKSYFDVYRELNDKDKVKFMDALLERQFWGIEPEGLKGMSNFAFISQKHSIDAQVKGYEDKMETKLFNPNAPPPAPPAIGANTPPPEQVEGKEEEEEEEKEKVEGKEQIGASPVFVFKTSLIDYGFKKQLVEDWLKVRKTKRATNTKTAFDSFILEIEKTGQEKNEIFKTIVESGWSSFKNSWLEKNIGPPDNGRYIKRDITDFEYE